MRLESINIGRSEMISHGGKSSTTGICKLPVDGPVRISFGGIPGDAIVASRHHGGPDQAIYAYSEFFTANVEHIDEAVFVRLLRGWAPLMEEFEKESGLKDLPTGAFLFRTVFSWGQETLAVWLGARVTLMIDIHERNVLRRKLALPWRDEEE